MTMWCRCVAVLVFVVASGVACSEPNDPTVSPGGEDVGVDSDAHDTPDVGTPDVITEDDTGRDPVVDREIETFDPDRLTQVSITMDPADFDELRNQTRTFYTELSGVDCRDRPFQSPYTYFPAAIEIDGESLPNVGVRKKGFIGSQSRDKPGFRINLDEYVEGAELFDTDNVTLNNGVQDPALIRQCVVYEIFAAAGYPAPWCNFAQVRVNDEELGVYVHVEPVKRRFLRRHFGNDDGDLFEGTLSDFRLGWYQTFEPKTDDTDIRRVRLAEVSAALDGGDVAAIAEHFDIPRMLEFLALETLVGHWDGYAGNRNNFYAYLDPSTDRFVFLPWGTDGTLRFERVDQPPYGRGELARLVLSDPQLSAQFAETVERLLDTVWDEEALRERIDQMEALVAAEYSGLARGQLLAQIDNVRSFVSARRQALERTLPGQPVPRDGLACLLPQGSINASFSTTWWSLDQDLTRAGQLELEIEWDGEPVELVRAGVGAGISEEGDPILLLVLVLDESAETLVILYINFDPDSVNPGQPLGLGEGGALPAQAGGGLLFTNPDIEDLVPIGTLQEGVLTFDALGTNVGDPVTGSFEATFYDWEELP